MFNKLNPKMRFCVGMVLIMSVPALFIAALILSHQNPPVEEPEADEPEVSTHEYTAALAVAQKRAEERVLPEQADKNAAEQKAIEFISAFHSVDAENPLAYLEAAKPFMTERMYDEYEGIPKRGTLGASKVESIAEEALPAELEERLQVWGVSVTSEETAIDGTVTITGSHYSVLLIKDGDEWIVDGVRANEY